MGSVAWSPSLGLLVGVGGDGNTVSVGSNQYQSSNVLTSPDGVTWTDIGAQLFYLATKVVWADSLGLFIVCGEVTGAVVDTLPSIYTSPDGVTWTVRHANGQADTVYWSPDYGMATVTINKIVGTSFAGQKVLRSTDGITWTESTTTLGYNTGFGTMYDAVNTGLWYAWGDASGSGPCLYSSADADTWTAISTPFDGGVIDDIKWVPSLGLWVISGTDSSYSYSFMTGPDLSTLTLGNTSYDVSGAANEMGLILDLPGAPDTLLAGYTNFDTSGAPTLLTSTDGVTWTIEPTIYDSNTGNWGGYPITYVPDLGMIFVSGTEDNYPWNVRLTTAPYTPTAPYIAPVMRNVIKLT
jgi:hypothetical protein